MAMKVKAKVKAKAKAMKVKDKVQHVQKAEDEANATAAAKKNTKANGKAAAAKSAMKKPASWNAWAEDDDDDDDDGEEEEEEVLAETDYDAPSKAQAKVFEDAWKRPPGTRGSLPVEIHEVWNNIQRGPGAAKERHALRNACVPKSVGYGHVCTINPNGLLIKRIKDVFGVKQKKVQMKGLTYSECLWSCSHGNEDAIKKSHS